MENLKKLIEELKRKFPPAESETESDIVMSTAEIENLVIDHDSSIDLLNVNIVQLLEEAGYHYEAIEKNDLIAFVWMMKEN